MQQVWEEWSITSAGLNYCALPCIAKPTCTPKYMNSGKLTVKDKIYIYIYIHVHWIQVLYVGSLRRQSPYIGFTYM